MFYVNGKPIAEDELVVLQTLKLKLHETGIERFATFKRNTDHIMFNCPMHKNGQESKPSCGITTKAIKQGDKLIPSGSVHCFACGYTSTLPEMISNLFGKNDAGLYGIRWLQKNFASVSYEQRPKIDLGFNNSRTPLIETPTYISEEELDSYRYTHPYMYKRKLTDEVIDMFDIGYDNNFVLTSKSGYQSTYRCITFPIRDETGGTLFIARRSVDTKMFHYPNNAIKPVYGLYEISKYLEEYPSEIIICESMLNALTCWSYGKVAVALNGTGTEYQYKQLEKLPTRKFILGLDPDDAGNHGRERIKHYFMTKAKSKKIFSDYIIPVGKDINDLSKEEFDNLYEKVV